jgi:hypothetical protein
VGRDGTIVCPCGYIRIIRPNYIRKKYQERRKEKCGKKAWCDLTDSIEDQRTRATRINNCRESAAAKIVISYFFRRI